jgi:hypothetical protein
MAGNIVTAHSVTLRAIWYTHACARTQTRMCTRTHTCTHACAHTQIHACAHPHAHPQARTQTRAHTHTDTGTHANTCTRTQTRAHTHTYVYSLTHALSSTGSSARLEPLEGGQQKQAQLLSQSNALTGTLRSEVDKLTSSHTSTKVRTY